MPINYEPPKGEVKISLKDYHKLTSEVELAREERKVLRKWIKGMSDFLQLVVVKEDLFNYIEGFNKRYTKEGIHISNHGGEIEIKIDPRIMKLEKEEIVNA